MKIGILTQPLRYNYGGILQNMALQTVLRKEGHSEVCTLDYSVPSKGTFALLKWEIKKRLGHLIDRKSFPVVTHIPTEAEKDMMFAGIDAFMERHIVRTPRFTSEEDFRRWAQEEDPDALIVGSDQCWRLRYNPFIDSMFLSFTDSPEVRRIAYAASFGTAAWEYDDALTARCSRLLSRFDGVSVRETSAVDLCRSHFGVRADLVLDPTMLLGPDEYASIVASEKVPASPGNLFVHLLDPDPEKSRFVREYAASRNLTSFSILPPYQVENLTRKAIRKHPQDCIYPSPAVFLRAFMDSEEVIVDSFHACVFAIIFHKPFHVLTNSSRGNARFDSLLELFSLQDRLVTPESPGSAGQSVPICWEHVDEVLSSMKESSIGFLRASLNPENKSVI